MALYGYIKSFTNSISRNAGQPFAQLLQKDSLHRTGKTNIQDSVHNITSIDDYCNGQVPAPYDEILALHFKGIQAISKRNFVEAYSLQADLAQKFIKLFSAEATNWQLAVLNVINVDLRLLAKLADKELREKGQKEDKLEDAARILNSCFSVCIRDGSPLDISKKWGTLHVINNLFKIYFLLNNLRLCKNLIRPVDSQGFPPLDQFPISQLVTYKFYVGRLAMFDGQFEKAEKELSFAFQKCTKKSLKNKRLILLYLVPVKIFLGIMPAQRLLEHYEMSQFIDLTKAVRSGNLRLFNQTLSQHQDYFIQKGIYLILEKAKILAYRNLFKKIYLIQNTTKLRLKDFERVFQWLGISMDIDEIECIVANLIYNNHIKGYLSHQAGYLVVSGKTPFPAVTSVI